MIRKKRVYLVVLLTVLLASASAGFKAVASSVELRDDGLTIVYPKSTTDNNEPIQYVTLIVKSGYTHDSKGKIGLMGLTNELLYYIFRYETSASAVFHRTYAEMSIFNFEVSRRNIEGFYKELDDILRMDAIMLYDFCNSLVLYKKFAPQEPLMPAVEKLALRLYGSEHPYYLVYNREHNFNIADVNKCFRSVFRPNNMMISTSSKLPESFLRRPTGKNFQKEVKQAAAQSPNHEDGRTFDYTLAHDNSTLVCMGFIAPNMEEEGFFSMVFVQKYLQYKLTEVLRKRNGLVYYVDVNYNATEQTVAPAFKIYFQTLPEEAGNALSKTLQLLESIAEEGIPKQEEEYILKKEHKRLELRGESLKVMVYTAALKTLYDLEWIDDAEMYLAKLENSREQVPKVLSRGLKRLKVSVAGPKGTVLDDSILQNLRKED